MTAKPSLDQLQNKHADLEEKLQREENRPMPDDGLITQMKKEKLRLKDAIAELTRVAA